MTMPTITSLLRQLWSHISPRRRRQFVLLLVLMVLAAGAEVFSIGAVLPFLAVLTNPERMFAHPSVRPVIQLLGINSTGQLLLSLTIVFSLAAFLAGALRLLLLWAGTSLSFATGADLGFDIYRRTLHQPYAVHVARNSSDIISGITVKTDSVIFDVLTPALTLASSLVILCAILGVLFWVNPLIALVAFCGFGAIYVLIIQLTRYRLLKNSQITARETTQVIKALQEGLGGIRDVLIDGSQETFCRIYRTADLRLRRAQGNTYFIGLSPRHGVEALGMMLIATLAYALARQPDSFARAIPVLGAMVLGAQRLLPLLQQSYNAWSNIQGSKTALQEILLLLDQPLKDYAEQSLLVEPLSFRQSIRMRQVGFRYSASTPWIFKDIDLTIPRGSRIGFVGSTGSGKSTLLDILMGLLDPTEGILEIDGNTIVGNNRRAWQAHIAHVPQSIYLTDSSIAENIAFGVPTDQIDLEWVRKTARDAQIADFIESLPNGYKTFVGERGIRLSGGQRQRIGIARALYKRADVLIFDEATSALDNETEEAVMQAIDGLSAELTILIIAHRVTTLKNCTRVVKLEDGFIRPVGSC